MSNRLLKVSEVADILRISQMTVIRKCRDGIIPFVMVGSMRRIREIDLEYYILTQSRNTRKPKATEPERPVYDGPPYGSSKLYDRKCYGYTHDPDGSLIIDDVEAKNVQMIFNLYLHGKSVLGILKELEQRGIKSPTGKDKWCKRTIDVMLSNEKYVGKARLLHSVKGDVEYLIEENNPPIISTSAFNRVQEEKIKRSNVVKNEDETIRKDKKYSSRRNKDYE